MEKLNENNFVLINCELAVCISDTKYKNFNVKKGMVIVDRELAIELFKCDESIKNIDNDIIVSYQHKDCGGFEVWVWNNGWKRITCTIDHDINLYSYLTEICNNIKDYDVMIKKPSNRLYTGEGFIIVDKQAGEKCNNGGEYGFYTNYRKTSIDGLYEIETWCTCDFDNCGTGFEGYRWITKDEFEAFKNSEDFLKFLKKESQNSLTLYIFNELLSRQI